ncbi:hypothetical protein SERLA73DRAFT_184716 [Serpula lacrymans var. lacrymans S7.3]|uniref:J domain-containing protein n=2 Tax=Serpula lacrymans var. lacrymans TaxID=341189 RepID=F8Q4Z2_SERL3|nr:uncharacterized protein SERLADRAFT_472643 [Serpula lacrymans var. lacrymans S7.9]EGN96619.1 hypothetical protein SERLA73DRAFT_184716 [Serpula lacrymans var. lacrymans S7.3]EGO22187.1 hypothetical protein SERLADRAFT_472643 [Serpula lacrymans var. lacrymans S7.9]
MTLALTLYDVLGIPSSASIDDVRKAYKQKALETHPDKLEPTASEKERRAAEGKFRNVKEAFEILSDPDKRKAYDIRIQCALKNSKIWDKEQEKRTNEREQWARQAKERSENRMKERADLYDSIRRMKQEQTLYTEVVDKLYQELKDMNPEWELRRKQALERKENAARKAQEPRTQRTR